jgi:hypothetical protein
MRDQNDNITGYALVSYFDYTKSAYSEDLNELITKYLSITENHEVKEEVNDTGSVTLTGIITDIASENIDGRTVYYIKINKQVYLLTSELNINIVFSKVGDVVEITFMPSNSEVIAINNIIFK